jgi:peptidoglycan/xylan/chitin deacetylase (PgdA/CDA1 family)
VAVAQGQYCLFLDDDIVAAPQLVAAHLYAQQEQEKVVGIGQITPKLPPHADWFAQAFARGWTYWYEQLNQGLQIPTWEDCYSGNISVERMAFQEIGGFAVDLPASFDVELGYRLEQHGMSFVYIPDALGEHQDDKLYRSLAADAQKQGAACVELSKRYPPMLPPLLGHFAEAKLYEILLRRLLLALPAPTLLLGWFGWLLGKQTWRYNWYRFLHRYFYWRGVRKAIPDKDTWQRLTSGVPILLYHAFGKPGEPANRYVVPGRRFAQQMAWLKRMGYHVLDLEEYLDYQHQYRLPPAHSVVITIDDGYADTCTLAYPILRHYGFPATIFLVSELVGSINQWDQQGAELAGRPLLGWSDIKMMQNDGIKFGVHTRTHPALVGMSAVQVKEEVKGAKTILEQELGTPIPVFAYPYGEYDETSRAVVKQPGFSGSCGIESGFNTPVTDPHDLRRIAISGYDTLFHFVLKLWLGSQRVSSYGKGK